MNDGLYSLRRSIGVEQGAGRAEGGASHNGAARVRPAGPASGRGAVEEWKWLASAAPTSASTSCRCAAAPLIMGHENVGYLAKVGSMFARHKGFKEGDLVFLEHYLPCGHCEWDHMGEYRHCAATEWFYDPKAIRYGYTSLDIAPSLWGGFSHYVYLPLNAVLHKVPKGLSPEEAGLATPMSNGIQWTLHGRRRRLRVHRADPGSWPAGTVLRHGGQAGRRRPHHRHRHVEGHASARGGHGARRGRGDRRAEGRRARAHPRSHERARRRRGRRLHAARARRRPCSASRRPSAGAGRWSCRARGTRRFPISRSGG